MKRELKERNKLARESSSMATTFGTVSNPRSNKQRMEDLEKTVQNMSLEVSKISDMQKSVDLLSATLFKFMESVKYQTVEHASSTPAQTDKKTSNPLPAVEMADMETVMPCFDGSAAAPWIFKAEEYFLICGASEVEKLELAAMSMEDRAQAWFEWRVARVAFQSWSDFSFQLQRRFGKVSVAAASEKLFKLRQKGSMEDYLYEFEKLAAAVGCLPDNVLEGAFLAGVRYETREAPRLLHPQGLDKVIETALRIDTRNY